MIDDNSGAKFSAWAGMTQAAYDEPAKEIAVKRNNSIVTLPPEEVARWTAAVQPVIDEWVAEMDGKGLNGKALLEEARALTAGYTK